MSIRISCGVLAVAVTIAACDRTPPTASTEETASAAAAPDSRYSVERAVMDRLAQRFARALADPAFRAYVKGELDRSPFAEHKLQLQDFLRASDGRALKDLARLSASSQSAVEQDLRTAIPLEFYLPVPSQRAEWAGGPDIL
ncbi:MAG TPA: hypothetical protein VGJ36_08000, partial [Gemmatimonadales bacterium]